MTENENGGHFWLVLLIAVLLGLIVLCAVLGTVYADEQSGMVVVRLGGFELLRRCLYPSWGCRSEW